MAIVGAPQLRAPRLQPYQPALHGVLGQALEREVEGGEHADVARVERPVAEARLQLLAHAIREVGRRLAGRHDDAGPHRLAARGLVVGVGEAAQLTHAREHDVAPLAGARGIGGGRVRVWSADHAGQERGFRHRQLVHLLAKVRAAGGGHATDGHGPALPEVNLVEVGLEDPLLAVPPLDERGQPRLVQLAHERALGIEQAVLHELLGDRAAALGHAAGAEVHPRRAHQPPQIDAGVVEEAMILGGQDRLQQAEGHVAQPHRAVVLTRPIAGARQHLGLEGGGPDVALVARDADDAVVAHLDAHALGAAQPRQSAQVDLPVALGAVELAGGVGGARRLGIRQPRQRAREVGDLHLDAGGEGLRRGVDERGAARLDAVEARELDGRVHEEGKQGNAADGGDPERNERAPPPRPRPRHEPRLPRLAEPGGPPGPRRPEGHVRLCPHRGAGPREGFCRGDRGQIFRFGGANARQVTRIPRQTRPGTAVATVTRAMNVGRIACS